MTLQTAEPETPGTREGTGPAAAEARGVRRVYKMRRAEPRVALDGVSIEVGRDERLALLGPNGSGKSTLLRLIATLDRPDDGEIRLFGERPSAGNVRAMRARIGVVFQAPGLDELLTIRENLLAQAALYGLTGRAAAERLSWASEGLGLTDRLDDRVKTLSGGLVRRADLARALLHEPDLLLLDEPTGGLDQRARMEFLQTLEHVAQSRSDDCPMAVIMTTHLMDEAERADRVALLDRGSLIDADTPDALRRRLGESILRCGVDPEGQMGDRIADLLRSVGLEPDHDSGREVRCRARSDGQLLPAVEALVREGIPFEVGPPTLGDVFMALTGRELAPELGAETDDGGNGR